MATTHPQSQPNPNEEPVLLPTQESYNNPVAEQPELQSSADSNHSEAESHGFGRFIHSKVGKATATFAGLALAAGAYTAVKSGESEKATAQPVASASASPSESASPVSTPEQSATVATVSTESAQPSTSPEAIDPKATAGIITTESGQVEIVNYATPFLVEAKGDTAEFGKPVVDAWFKAYQSLLIPSESTNMTSNGIGGTRVDYDMVLNDFKGLLDAKTWQHADDEFEPQRNIATYEQTGLVGLTNSLITTMGSLSTEVSSINIQEHEVGNIAAVQFKISITNTTGDHEITQLFKLSFAKAELQKTDGTKTQVWQVNSYQYSPIE